MVSFTQRIAVTIEAMEHNPSGGRDSAAFVDGESIVNGLTVDSCTWQVLFLAWPFENMAQPDADVVMLAAMSWFSWFNTQPEVSLPLVAKNY